MTMFVRIDPRLPYGSGGGVKDGTRPPAPGETAVQLLYEGFLAEYEEAWKAWRWPSHPVLWLDRVEEYRDPKESDDGEVRSTPLPPGTRITVDATLLGSLAYLYAAHGWDALRLVARRAYQSALAPSIRTAAAGARPSLHESAALFVSRTVLLLGRAVRDALIPLETRAAELLTGQLRETERLAAQTLKQFEVDEIEPDMVHRMEATFRIGNDDLLQEVHARLRAVARNLEEIGHRAGRRERVARGGLSNRLMTEEQRARGRTETLLASFDREIARYQAIVSELTATDLFTKTCPLALIALGMMDSSTFASTLGERLVTALNHLKALSGWLITVKPGGQIGALPPPQLPGAPVYEPGPGPERQVIAAALAGGERWAPMLQLPVWDALIDDPLFDGDDWIRLVACRYRDALAARIEAEERRTAQDESFFARLGWIAALLSVLALVLAPVGGLLVLALSVGAAAMGLAVAVHQVSAVVRGAYDTSPLLAVQVDGDARLGLAELARIGQIADFRMRALGETLTEIAVEQIAQLAGASLVALGRALDARDLMGDLDTLMTTAHPAGEGEPEPGEADSPGRTGGHRKDGGGAGNGSAGEAGGGSDSGSGGGSPAEAGSGPGGGR